MHIKDILMRFHCARQKLYQMTIASSFDLSKSHRQGRIFCSEATPPGGRVFWTITYLNARCHLDKPTVWSGPGMVTIKFRTLQREAMYLKVI